jgi:hypothetical protein
MKKGLLFTPNYIIISQAVSPVTCARAGLMAFIFSIKTPTACTNKSCGGMAPEDSMLTMM